MCSNSIGTNIANAFKVVSETCESVGQLFSFLNQRAKENNEYIPLTEKPLTHLKNSDFNDEYILVFQRKKDRKSLYVLDVSLWNNENGNNKPDEAKIYISKFEYDKSFNLNNFPISKGDFYLFADPVCEDVTDLQYEGNSYSGTVNAKVQAENEYRGLQRVVGFSVPLVNINADNAEEKVFGGFHALIEK